MTTRRCAKTAAAAAHLVESYPENVEPSFIDAFVQFTDILVAANEKTVSHIHE